MDSATPTRAISCSIMEEEDGSKTVSILPRPVLNTPNDDVFGPLDSTGGSQSAGFQFIWPGVVQPNDQPPAQTSTAMSVPATPAVEPPSATQIGVGNHESPPDSGNLLDALDSNQPVGTARTTNGLP
ncbi:hypothetical protein RJ55_02343 [Drechmeria coniospora]|nr:hypothetical protein RJ55_02343 [Drechmeria coniospora]